MRDEQQLSQPFRERAILTLGFALRAVLGQGSFETLADRPDGFFGRLAAAFRRRRSVRAREDCLSRVARRQAAYRRVQIAAEIAEQDDMHFAGGTAQYMQAGRSAIDVIARAMVAANKSEIRNILDLPCGGGRVTRHLKAFFPGAPIFCADVNKTLERFVVDRFGATPVMVAADFSTPPEHKFDFIWVGSLLTHFTADQLTRTFNWYADALMPNGILVATFHGRRVYYGMLPNESWGDVVHDYERCGFGFRVGHGGEPVVAGLPYGGNVTSLAWMMGLIQPRSDLTLVGLIEAGWADFQDVMVIQKRPVVAGRG